MKRLLAWILALCTIFSLAACGGKGGKEEPEEVIDMTVLNARDLKVNNLTDPLGIDTEPTFCWTNKTNTVGRVQTAYQIIVASTKELAEAHTGDIWDTGKVASDENFDIPYEGKNYHLDVGHIGAELILPLLSQEGHGDIAMKILLQTDYPSWGYWVKQGSTTCWEGWSESVVRSYCHFFLGSYDEWFYQNLAGIRDPRDGYKTVTIRPEIFKELGHVNATVQTVRGELASGWKVAQDGSVTVTVTVPVGTTADILLPIADAQQVQLNGAALAVQTGIAEIGEQDGRVLVRAISGTYTFDLGTNAITQ